MTSHITCTKPELPTDSGETLGEAITGLGRIGWSRFWDTYLCLSVYLSLHFLFLFLPAVDFDSTGEASSSQDWRPVQASTGGRLAVRG